MLGDVEDDEIESGPDAELRFHGRDEFLDILVEGRRKVLALFDLLRIKDANGNYITKGGGGCKKFVGLLEKEQFGEHDAKSSPTRQPPGSGRCCRGWPCLEVLHPPSGLRELENHPSPRGFGSGVPGTDFVNALGERQARANSNQRRVENDPWRARINIHEQRTKRQGTQTLGREIILMTRPLDREQWSEKPCRGNQKQKIQTMQ